MDSLTYVRQRPCSKQPLCPDFHLWRLARSPTGGSSCARCFARCTTQREPGRAAGSASIATRRARQQNSDSCAAVLSWSQAYFFDLNGFIVLPGLLDAGSLAELKRDAKGVENNGPSSRTNFGNSEGAVLHWNRAYRDLMAHPTVVPILQELCGPRFRLDHINVHTHVADGYPGSSLHGGHSPGNGNGFFFHSGGRMMNGLVSVTYELEDTQCNGGGL